MRFSNRLTRAAQCFVLAAALTAFGCPGDDELGLYCSLVAAFAAEDFDYGLCLDYNPGEFQEYRAYFDDVRAYQGLLAHRSITGPGTSSFDDFMAARYPDWAQRGASLRAALVADGMLPAVPRRLQQTDILP